MGEFSFSSFFALLRSKWIIIAAAIVICLVIGAAYSYAYVTPMYESNTTVILRQSNGSVETDPQVLASYYQISTSRAVMQDVVDALHLDMAPDTLSKSIKVQKTSSNAVLVITAYNKDSATAADIANNVVSCFSKEVGKVYSVQNIYVLYSAVPSDAPYNISHGRDIAVAALIGAALGLASLFLFYLLDATVRSEADIENGLKISVLASVPDISPSKKERAAIR